MSRKQKWELVLRNVDELIKQANASLYDRVVMLKQVWDDPEFLAFHGSDVDAADEHLSSKLGDYAITFFNAIALLKHYPHREAWAAGNLRQMLATALESEQRSRDTEPKTERKKPVAHDEHERVKSELESQIQTLTSRGESLAEECARLRQDNQELRRENAELRGRVMELERIARRELAAV